MRKPAAKPSTAPMLPIHEVASSTLSTTSIDDVRNQLRDWLASGPTPTADDIACVSAHLVGCMRAGNTELAFLAARFLCRYSSDVQPRWRHSQGELLTGSPRGFVGGPASAWSNKPTLGRPGWTQSGPASVPCNRKQSNATGSLCGLVYRAFVHSRHLHSLYTFAKITVEYIDKLFIVCAAGLVGHSVGPSALGYPL